MPTVEDLRREVAGRPLGRGTINAMSGSFDGLLRNINNLATQDQIVDLAAPFFPTSTDRGMAALTSFVFGVINNWDKIKKTLIDKGVAVLVQAIDKAWQAVKDAAAEFWTWLSKNWKEILEIALAVVGGVLLGVNGAIAGAFTGVEIGGLIGGPIGAGIGAVIGAAIGGGVSGFAGATVGASIGRDIRNR